MSTTYTANAKLQKPGHNDRNWDAPVNANADQLDAVNAIGGLSVTLHETPSTTLTVAVSAGSFVSNSGAIVAYAGSTSTALTLSTTQRIWLTNAGVLTTGVSWPATAYVPLATVVVGATTITSIADARVSLPTTTHGGFLLLSGGTLADGANVTVGATTGTQIGTATTGKLAFFGRTPVVQQTGGAATAGGTYTAAEQSMINSMYTALRNLGLLS